MVHDQDLVLALQSAPTYLDISDNTISEAAQVNTSIASLSLVGPESYRDVTFSLLDADNQADTPLFVIDGSSLLLLESLDFETAANQSVTILAEDSDGFSLETTFNLEVVNSNETPTDFIASTSVFPEDLPSRSIVAIFSSSDPDQDDNLSYSSVSYTHLTLPTT